MASWASLKVLNSALWLGSSVYQWGTWFLWGPQDSPELRIAKQNQVRLEKIENNLQQLWAVQNGVSLQTTELEESVIVVNKKDEHDKHDEHKHDKHELYEEYVKRDSIPIILPTQR